MEQKYAVVLLAAGIGSRFGGVKQLKRVGPAGEVIMDYSVYDALEAGFNKVVFIIRKDIEAGFREVIGDRIEAECAKRGVEVAYAFQELENLPGGYVCPADRTKPWGTGHAMLACKGLLNEPFVVLNADDYYGKDAFVNILSFLKEQSAGEKGRYCMAGFHLRNTLSDIGGVTRGICSVNDDGWLTQVHETRNIHKTASGAVVRNGEQETPLDLGTYVSMNMWGFTPDLMEHLEEQFLKFLGEFCTAPKSEFLLPEVVDLLLREEKVAVRMLPTKEQWFGMTYQEDVPPVRDAFHKMVEQGIYKPGLF